MIGGRCGIALLAFALPVLPAVVVAHPYIVGSEVEPGEHFEGKLVLTHDCNNQPTVEVVLRMPREATHIEADSPKGWKSSVDPAKGEIVWQGDPTPDRMELGVSFEVPQVAEGTKLYIPVVQRCTGGEVQRWVEMPDAEKKQEDLGFPAAFVIVGKKAGLPEGEEAADEAAAGGGHKHHHQGHHGDKKPSQ
jgi:uncharacterized protein YcnI